MRAKTKDEEDFYNWIKPFLSKHERKALRKDSYIVIDLKCLVLLCKRLMTDRGKIVKREDSDGSAYARSCRVTNKENRIILHVVSCLKKASLQPLLASLLHEFHHVYFCRAIENCGVYFDVLTMKRCNFIVDAMEFDEYFMTEGEIPNPKLFYKIEGDPEIHKIEHSFEDALKFYLEIGHSGYGMTKKDFVREINDKGIQVIEG